MNDFAENLKKCKTKKGISQEEISKKMSIHPVQFSRYERGQSIPSIEVLQKLAAALDTTTDYLMNGSNDEVVSAQLTDKELLSQFREVEKLDQEDKQLVKTFIDAFITKRKIQKLAV